MSQGDFMKFSSKVEVEKKAQHIIERMKEWDFARPLCLILEPYQNVRTVSQNALLHMWCREIVKGMKKKGFTVAEGDAVEAWKLWLKRRFLGTDDFRISKTEILGQVRRSSKLSKGDMVNFMDQCYHWASEQGIKLTIPRESEYAELKNQQEN